MENPKDLKGLKDKIIGYIEGYKHLQFLLYCLKRKDYNRLREVYTNEEVDFLTWLYFYVRYQENDYYLYTRLNNAIENGPLLSAPHDIDLEAYVKGLYERNQLVWLGADVKKIFGFVEHKKVLDFGCGGCFYTEMFDKLGAITFSYDKPDIANIVKGWKPSICIYTKPLKELLPLMLTFDMVWLSEVLHSKEEKDRHLLLRDISSHTNNGTLIIINELKPHTILSQLFFYQMKVHTKGGKLLDRKDIHNAIGLLPLSWKNTIVTDYHTIYIYQKEG